LHKQQTKLDGLCVQAKNAARRTDDVWVCAFDLYTPADITGSSSVLLPAKLW
jgi:hypothetical protein